MYVNSNIIIIIVALLLAGGAIYILYSIILFQGSSKGEDLQLSTKNILDQVQVLFEKQEYALVELLATKYLDRVPGHTDVRAYLAKAFYEDKKYNFAIKQCQYILKKRPNDIDTHLVLAKCYKNKLLLSKAIDEFEIVFEKNKKDPYIIKTLAQLYRDCEQLHMAIEYYGALAEITEDQDELAGIYSVIAELNEEVHDYPAAFEAYKTRLGIYPKDVDTNKKLTELYVRINNYPVAIENLLYMLSFVTDPKMLLWVYGTLIDLYELTEDYEKAIAYSEKILDVQGSDKFKVRDRIASFNVKLGKINDGILILEDLALMSQNAFDITIELAQAYITNKEYQKALDKYLLLLDKATQKEAKNINTLICDLYITWSIDATSEKSYDRALELLKSAMQYNTINPEVYYHIAVNNFEQKQFALTVDSLNKALDFDKEKTFYTKYLLLLAEAHHELNNFFEEKKSLTDLLNIDSKDPEGLYRVGLMYAAQHDIKNAEEAFKNAILYDPDFVQAKYNLALLYENSNRERAKELYMEVLEQDPTFVEAKNALADISTSDYYY